MGYLGKHRVFRPMRRHPVVIASGAATALVIVTTGVVFAKIAQDSQGPSKINQVAVGEPSTPGTAAPTGAPTGSGAAEVPGATDGAAGGSGQKAAGGAVTGGGGTGRNPSRPTSVKSSPAPQPTSAAPTPTKSTVPIPATP